MTSDPFEDDPWISTTSPIGPKRLHALGLVTLRWNVCEYSLFHVFCETMRLPDNECWALAHNLGDVSLSERIAAIARIRKLPAAVQTRTSDVLAFYDICRQNRNFLAHALFSDHSEPGSATLTRRSKKIDEMAAEPFSSSLEDIRRVANDLSDLHSHLFHLELALMSDPLPPSRDKLKMPDLLWKPLPTQKAPKRPPAT